MALTIVTAQAQVGGTNGLSPSAGSAMNIGQHASSDPRQSGPKVKANDNAYNSALKNLPDKQYDPWHGVR
jgi:hypothetical protein